MHWFTRMARSPWYHAFWGVWCAVWAIGYAWAHDIFWMSFYISMLLLWAVYIGKSLVHYTTRPKMEFSIRGLSPEQLAYVETKLKANPNVDVTMKFEEKK